MNPEVDSAGSAALDELSAAPAVKMSAPRTGDARVQDLFAREYKQLINFVVGFGVGRADAEDVAAQAFAQLLEVKDRALINELEAYLYKTARNITFNKSSHLAMQQRNGPLLMAAYEEESPSPEVSLIGEQQSELISHALMRLPPIRRACVILRFWGDLSYPEIVKWFRRQNCAINERTVRRNVGRGMEETRKAIQATEAPAKERYK